MCKLVRNSQEKLDTSKGVKGQSAEGVMKRVSDEEKELTNKIMKMY